jgi:putative peptidoglycan lipid II flippase
VVVALVLVAIAATAWVLTNSPHKGAPSAAGGQAASGTGGTSTAAASVVLKPTGDNTYNAYKPSDNEDAVTVGNAIDGNPATAWATEWYGTAQFGDLKPGTGLILSMGKNVKLSQLEVLFSAKCCTSASIYIGNTSTVSTTAFATFTKVAAASNISGDHKFTITSAATGRYVIIWLTSLPQALPGSGAPSGYHQGLIYEVTVRGTPTSG